MDETSIPDLSPEEARKVKKREQARLCAQRWRAHHPDRAKAAWKKYKDANKSKTALQWQRYYARNHERLLQASRLRREKHPEKAKAADRKWKKAHPEAQKAWRKKHPEKVKTKNARRRAREAAAPINDFTDGQWEALCKAVKYRCCYCGKKFPSTKLEPDHLTPYNDNGSNTLQNILPACRSCNSRKSERAVLKPVQPFLLLSDEAAAD